MCKCGAKAARFTSWSDLHSGMRYLKCARARVGGCDFWLWVDPPHSPFVKQLLLDLRDAGAFADVERSNAALQDALADARRENASLQAAYAEARRENVARSLTVGREDADVNARRDVQSLQVVLVGRIGQLEKERMNLFSVLLCCVMVVTAVLCLSH
ncbi:hypothetical protein PVAP13_3KG129600 [Panicum virgatum]|uniref:Zinc finger GRF-type domain-containing protein n=1 Tax=Panicum virgatum TaxID=38727 RepID=A0A8T0UWG1_PANVG|nr:hypothetical protein PVAP13_3KG129600 [Panicum virgatum]